MKRKVNGYCFNLVGNASPISPLSCSYPLSLTINKLHAKIMQCALEVRVDSIRLPRCVGWYFAKPLAMCELTLSRRGQRMFDLACLISFFQHKTSGTL